MAERLPENLKPFYQRATEAEERIARLEAALASKKDTGNEEVVEKISELQSNFEEANTKLEWEQKKNDELQSKIKELTIENEKQKYRTKHLVRALKTADEKIERLHGNSGGSKSVE